MRGDHRAAPDVVARVDEGAERPAVLLLDVVEPRHLQRGLIRRRDAVTEREVGEAVRGDLVVAAPEGHQPEQLGQQPTVRARRGGGLPEGRRPRHMAGGALEDRRDRVDIVPVEEHGADEGEGRGDLVRREGLH